MDLDTAKIDDAVLGLLYLTLHEHNRVWKSMDWDAMSRLHQRGYISDPVNKSKSVVLTDAGLLQAKRVVAEKFTTAPRVVSQVQYGGKRATAWSANGVSGVLCRDAVDGRCFFRIYRADHSFTDFAVRHDDLAVTINPLAAASFYAVGEEYILDHSPAVLGLQPVDGNSVDLDA